MAAKFGVFVDEDHSKLPTLYWLPNIIQDTISHVLLLTLANVLLLRVYNFVRSKPCL